jgi:hypothetical protein
MLSTNTHSYDGTLGQWLPSIQKYIDEYNSISEENKRKIPGDLKEKLKGNPEMRGNAEAGLMLLSADFQKAPNYDNSNGLCADYLMYICLSIKNEDFDKALLEQIGDIITLGPCPQGRTTRLLQIILPFIDSPSQQQATSTGENTETQ